MSKVIDFATYKAKKTSKESKYTWPSDQHDRVRASLVKINKLFDELKALAEEQKPK